MIGRALNRKLWRELIDLKAQIVTIASVVAIGIGNLIGFLSAYHSLEAAQQRFYQRANFADVFVQLKRAPQSKRLELRAIPGVREVQTGLRESGLITLAQAPVPASAQLISLPRAEDQRLNQLLVTQGRWPLHDRGDEVLVGEAFAKAHGLKPGDALRALIAGASRDLVVTGVAVSPEFIFTVGAGGLPDDLHYGIIWMNEDELAGMTGQTGAFNHAAFRIDPRHSLESIVFEIDRILESGGSLGAYARAEQSSHYFLNEELHQLQVQATTVPLLFMFVAAYLLYVVLGRLISTQRNQIATLRAIGYDRFTIAAHFVKLGSVIALIGWALGVALGSWVGRAMVSLYADFYRFPDFPYESLPAQMAWGAVISLATALAGVGLALRDIYRLTPAEAMRPPTPAAFHKNRIERLGVIAHLSSRARMAVRGLWSNPIRSLLTLLGMSFTVLLAMTGGFWLDVVNELITVQYGLIQKENVRVTLSLPKPEAVLGSFRLQEGVTWAEGYRIVPVRVMNGNYQKKTSLAGLPQNPELWGLIDRQHRPVDIPPRMMLMSSSLARQLHLSEGDEVRLKLLEGHRSETVMKVQRIVDDFLGSQIYMNRADVNRLMSESDVINLVSLRLTTPNRTSLYQQLTKIPGVAAVTFKDTALASFRETSAQTMIVVASILMLFAAMITFGIVYNSARVSLAERDWELATLRILGFRKFEVFTILVGEIWLLLLVCIPVGWALGTWTSYLLLTSMSPEAMQMPFVIYPRTFTTSAIVLLIAGLFSMIFIGMKIRRLDLISTLKSRG